MTHGAPDPAPPWWTAPGATDVFAIGGLVGLLLLVWAIIHLYARYDRYAEHRAEETPLRTTVPTLLTIALAYEIVPPLSHFSILLPTALVLAALARDFLLWRQGSSRAALADTASGVATERVAEPSGDAQVEVDAGPEKIPSNASHEATEAQRP